MLAAEAKKADGAKRAALRIPKPLSPIGRVTSIQPISVMLVFRILDRPDRKMESKRSSSKWFVHGDDRMVHHAVVSVYEPRTRLRVRS